MHDQQTIEQLRRNPVEWRRRGLTPPAELDRIVLTRLSAHAWSAEPAYADFFTG